MFPGSDIPVTRPRPPVQTFQFTREALWYRDMAFSPDGRWLALSGKPFSLLDTTGGAGRRELPLGDFRRAFAFARGGAAVVYFPELQKLAEYDLATGATRTRRVEKGYPNGVVADRAGETLYVSAGPALLHGKSDVRVLSASSLKQRAAFGTVRGELRTLALSGDGQWLACHSWTGLRVWRLGQGKIPTRAAVCVRRLPAGYAFAISCDGSRLATTSSRGVTVWDAARGKRVAFSGRHRRAVKAVAASPTQPLFATGDGAGNVFLWDTALRVLRQYDWGLGEVCALAFDPDGLRCAAADDSGKVVVWDVDA